MIAGHITVCWPEGMKGVAVIAYEKSGGSSVRGTVTATGIEIVTATETAATAATEIVTAIEIMIVAGIATVIEIMIVIGIGAVTEIATEVEIAIETVTATEGTATAIAIPKIEESRIRFSYSAM